MEFIKSLYNSDYFLYILLGIIVVLIILFLVILFSGRKKKDENELIKENSIDEMPKDEPVNLGTVTSSPQDMGNHLDETKEFAPNMTSNYQNNEFLSTNTPIVNNVEVNEPIINEPKIEEPIIPAPVSTSEIIMPEPIVEEPKPMETPLREEPTMVMPEVKEEPIFNPFPNASENTTKIPNVNQYSSVFIDNGNPGMNMEPNNNDFSPVDKPIDSIDEIVKLAEEKPTEPKMFSVVDDELPKLNDENKEL